jgi:competence protein ComEA
MWKQFVADYLSFTKKQRSGTLILLVLIVLLIIGPFLFPFFIHPKTNEHPSMKKEIDTLAMRQKDAGSNYQRRYVDDGHPPYYEPAEKRYAAKQPFKGELFYFDPNTLEEEGWQKLGVREKTIATIKNYLSKGGKFYKAEDLSKVWGLSDDDKARLIPFARIESAGFEKKFPAKVYDKPAYEKKVYTPHTIDVNAGDTSAFIGLPGIGSKLSQRIVNFRDKLGGFHSIDQVGETFGLPDSIFQKIKAQLTLTDPAVKQINLNTATFDELKAHPYLRYGIANAIVQYRTQHGNFSSVADLKKIMLVTDDILVKAAPYLKIN